MAPVWLDTRDCDSCTSILREIMRSCVEILETMMEMLGLSARMSTKDSFPRVGSTGAMAASPPKSHDTTINEDKDQRKYQHSRPLEQNVYKRLTPRSLRPLLFIPVTGKEHGADNFDYAALKPPAT